MKPIALLSIVTLAACADGGPSLPTVEQTTQALAPGDEIACRHRYVGIRTTPTCPIGTPNWDRAPQPLTPAESGALPDRMKAYCVYDWAGAGEPPASPMGLPGGAAWLEPDCAAVGIAGTPSGSITEIMGDHLARAYHRGVDRVQTLPVGPDTTMLAIVDSSPTEWSMGHAGEGRMEHGRSVAIAARTVACTTSLCAADLLSVLALPRTDFGTVDPALGGYFGTQSELARGIFKAIDEWDTFPHTRLVINLSVGWEKRFGGPVGAGPHTLKPSVRMVYDAIAYARCRGAIVVAAAGNKSNDAVVAVDTGLLYPAAWSQRTAPSQTDCAGITPAFAGDVRAAPTDGMLIPVAGLTWTDAPLHNARLGTRTRIEAPGANVATYDPEVSTIRPALTGSSMSAGAVSAAAATLWAYHPALAPHEIEALLYDHAVDLTTPADVCAPGAPCGNSRRLSVCQSLNAVCADPASLCYGVVNNCLAIPFGAGIAPNVPPATQDANVAAIQVDHDEGDYPGLIEYYTNCDGVDVFYNGDINSDPDPICFQGVVGTRTRPWVQSQPDGTGCDICFYYDTKGYIRINPADIVDPAKNAMMFFTDGTTITAYDLSAIDSDLASMTAGETYKVGIGDHSTAKAARIEFTVNGTFVSDEVLLY